MECLGDFYDEAEDGILDKDDYMHALENFLHNGIFLDPWDWEQPQYPKSVKFVNRLKKLIPIFSEALFALLLFLFLAKTLKPTLRLKGRKGLHQIVYLCCGRLIRCRRTAIQEF